MRARRHTGHDEYDDILSGSTRQLWQTTWPQARAVVAAGAREDRGCRAGPAGPLAKAFGAGAAALPIALRAALNAGLSKPMTLYLGRRGCPYVSAGSTER